MTMAFRLDWPQGNQHIILCLTHFITPVFTLYHLKWNLLKLEQSIGKSFVDCKVDDLVKLDVHDAE